MKDFMQTLIYNLLNKFFMNEIEDEIIKFLRKDNKLIKHPFYNFGKKDAHI